MSRYTCNAEETDTRMWLHAKQAPYERILVISPDTDIYHIGMPLYLTTQKDIIVQINKITSKDLKFFHLPAFVNVIKHDPDFSSIERDLLPQIFQTLYVVTGCDYTSFFCKMGKATFYKHFFQNAEFITSGKNEAPGTLADINILDGTFENGFLALLRLIGVSYFKKNNSGFSHATPQAHFKSLANPECTPHQQHREWINNLRLNIGDRCPFENLLLPGVDALYRHWKRSCWVINMWRQADVNQMQLQPLSNNGWKIMDNTLTVDWESDENVAAINARVSSLLKGCKCKSGCGNMRCGCRKNGRECSVGCECINCTNIPSHTEDIQGSDNSLADIAVEEEYFTNCNQSEELTDDDPEDISELLDWVFNEHTS